jgi:hypothetical protein
MEDLRTALAKNRMPTRWGSVANRHDLLTLLAETAARAEDRAALEEFALSASEVARGYGHRLYAAIADRALGVLARLQGDPDAARIRFHSALQAFEDLGTGWQAGRTQGELAVLEQEHGSSDESQRWLERALASFEVVQAAPDRLRLIHRLSP